MGQRFWGCSSETKCLRTCFDMNVFPGFGVRGLVVGVCPGTLDTPCITIDKRLPI